VRGVGVDLLAPGLAVQGVAGEPQPGWRPRRLLARMGMCPSGSRPNVRACACVRAAFYRRRETLRKPAKRVGAFADRRSKRRSDGQAGLGSSSTSSPLLRPRRPPHGAAWPQGCPCQIAADRQGTACSHTNKQDMPNAQGGENTVPGTPGQWNDAYKKEGGARPFLLRPFWLRLFRPTAFAFFLAAPLDRPLLNPVPLCR
jgi:hypothetical protein